MVEGDAITKPEKGIHGISRPLRDPAKKSDPTDLGDELEKGEGDGSGGDGYEDGDNKRHKSGGGSDTIEKSSTGSGGQSDSLLGKEVEVEARTFFDVTAARYRMVAKFPGAGNYDITIFAIGDDGKPDAINIESAVILFGKKERAISASKNRLVKVKVDGNARVEIRFSSASLIPRTLRARAYQNV